MSKSHAAYADRVTPGTADAVIRAAAALHTATMVRDLIGEQFAFYDADQFGYESRRAIEPIYDWTPARVLPMPGPVITASDLPRAVLTISAWTRGVARAEQDGIRIQQAGRDWWIATSGATGDWAYDVRQWGPSPRALSCTCAAGRQAVPLICKHMAMVAASIDADLQEAADQAAADAYNDREEAMDWDAEALEAHFFSA